MSLELMRLVIYRPLIENSKAPGKYVKHTPEQVELLLANLFEGKQERT
jgi:exocyst complex protein 7